MKFESQDYTSFIFICNKNSSHLALSIIVKLCLLQSDLPTLPGGCVVQVVPKMSIYSWCNMFSSRSDQGIEPKQFSQIKFIYHVLNDNEEHSRKLKRFFSPNMHQLLRELKQVPRQFLFVFFIDMSESKLQH